MKYHVISFRPYESIEDLELQYQFWRDVTTDLDLAWKPTKSPSQYQQSTAFDPRSRQFAFEQDRLVGYMSFTGASPMLSFGFPWTLNGYENIRDELWERVFNFAIDEYGATKLIQRFRAQWKEQISYFEEKGFYQIANYPIFGIDPSNYNTTADLEVTISPDFDLDKYVSFIRDREDLPEEMITNTRTYLETVDMDREFVFHQGGEIEGIVATTLREDNGLSEIVAFSPLAIDEADLPSLFAIVGMEMYQLGASILSITIPQSDKNIPIYHSLGFEQISSDVYLQYDVELG